jgi:GNAT superfamily N-acetyltransferase
MALARAATQDDIEAIVAAVTSMFFDLGEKDVRSDWHAAAVLALRRRLWADAGAFVVDATDDRLAAVAVGVIETRLPSPRRVTPQVGYIEWVWTSAEQRSQGLATAVVNELVSWMQRAGATVVDVHSSGAARNVYAGLGFQPNAKAMRRRS